MNQLIPWDSEEGDELPIDFHDQAQSAPSLVVEVDVEAIHLHRTKAGLSFDPLLDYFDTRVPVVRNLAADLMGLRLKFMRRYPRVVREEPDLLFF